jgi:signal transduction histidine kinase
VCHLRVVDNGIGLGVNQNENVGLGLVNLRRRAEKMHGTMEITTSTSGGTVLEWEVPVSQ